jgi:hypothetical protein
MKILCLYSGEYGVRHIANLQRHAPASWSIEIWQAPAVLPLIVDYPEDYLPVSLPQAHLILSFAETPGAAQLIPDIARMTGAAAVIAGIDSEAWLPRGLARQLRGWLDQIGVACATPKPLCTLTETHYSLGRSERIEYRQPLISEFARYFGRPEFEIAVDPESRELLKVEVLRDAVCGCARYAAEGLAGQPADDAEEKAGMLHHHFPCLASMGIDRDWGDTLMHISGNLLRDAVGAQVKPYKRTQTITPGTRSE